MAKTGILGVIESMVRGIEGIRRAARISSNRASSVAKDDEYIGASYVESYRDMYRYNEKVVCIESANLAMLCYRRGSNGLEPI